MHILQCKAGCKASITIVGILLIHGCSRGSATDKDGADVKGRITGIIPATASMRRHGILGFVRIEGPGQGDARYDKAALTLTDTTRIRRRAGTTERILTFDSIATGMDVEALFTGPVRQSYPVQATAASLVVTGTR